MVWKFPNKLPREEQIKIKEELMHEICQDKTRSTYQVRIRDDRTNHIEACMQACKNDVT